MTLVEIGQGVRDLAIEGVRVLLAPRDGAQAVGEGAPVRLVAEVVVLLLERGHHPVGDTGPDLLVLERGGRRQAAAGQEHGKEEQEPAIHGAQIIKVTAS